MFKQNTHLAFGWVCILLFAIQACSNNDEALPDTTYTFVKPAHFPEPTYTFENNEITKEGFELGKKLFFDPILSADGSISCNSCHIQSTAFSDSQQHPLSLGVENRMGIRNAPSLSNMAFIPDFFWDGGVNHLDFVAINAIESDFEMDETLKNVVLKLAQHDEYPKLFQQAFGIETPTSPYMLQALSQFMLLMVSDNSKYDQFIRDEITLSDSEIEGMQLFQSKCSACHQGELFTDFSFRNNGLATTFTDTGRERITENPADKGKFRVPSLRNIGLTSPYMHSAKFKTLEEVLQHYAEDIQQSETLDPLLKDGIHMSLDEQQKIITFLNTLTDQKFRTDKRFRNN